MAFAFVGALVLQRMLKQQREGGPACFYRLPAALFTPRADLGAVGRERPTWPIFYCEAIKNAGFLNKPAAKRPQ